MIEHDLARIANALEQIAQIMAGTPHPGGTESRPLPTDIDSQAAQAGNAEDAEHLKREQLKADLRLLGVAFKDSVRTSTLQKLLDDKLASMPHPESMDSAEGETPKETEEPEASQECSENETPATRDDVRMALIELSAAKGKDAALAMLRKVGGAEKLSDVAEDRYAAIVKACKEQCNG